MRSSQILIRAASIIDERGHCQGRMEDEQGRCCGLQAMIYAAGGERTSDVNDAYQAWCQQTGYAIVSAGCSDSYNDTHTAEEVKASLRAAAKFDTEHYRIVSEFL